MSNLVRDRARAKLHNLLRRADDEWFLQLVWAAEAVQAGRSAVAARAIKFPAEAAGAQVGSVYRVHPWEMETILNELFVTDKNKLGRNGKSYFTDCGAYATMMHCAAALRQLENSESGLYLKRMGIFSEMHRLAQRQFHWQRGYFNLPQFYRSAYIYSGAKCASHFQNSYGISIDQFSLIGFAIYGATENLPLVTGLHDLSALQVTDREIQAALALCAIPIEKAREKARSLRRSNWPTAYQPSILRQAPAITFGKKNDRIRVPIRELLLQRITSGIFYDLVSGKSDLRNESAERFEGYSYDLLRVSLPEAKLEREFEYSVSRTAMKSSDIIIGNANEISLVVECKGTKLSLEAQFSERPEDDARAKLDELAKGVFQVWRFYSHVRMGIAGSRRAGAARIGMVLTLDSWMTLAREMQAAVFARAETLADADPIIEPSDRCPVLFCPIYEMESLLSSASEAEFGKRFFSRKRRSS